MELNREYAPLSAVRFRDGWRDDEMRQAIERLDAGENVDLYVGALFHGIPG